MEATLAPLEPRVSKGIEEAPPAGDRFEHRIAVRLLMLVPGALVVYFGFNAGGFFPGSVAFATLIVTQLLLIRVLGADRPFAGMTRPLVVVAGAMTAFTAWTLLSGVWSHSHDRPLIEFDRALLYLELLILIGLVAREAWHVQWLVRGLIGGIGIVCGAALISRVAPHVLPTATSFVSERLSYPVTYWNALGILAAIGIFISLGATSSLREPRLLRAVEAAAVPPLAATMLFTFSRGAIWTAAACLVVYVLVARPINAFGALLATVPTAAVAMVVAYDAKTLSTTNLTSPTAISQGKHVALAVAICMVVAAAVRLLAIPLDRRLSRAAGDPELRRVGRVATAACVVIAIVVALALGAPSFISREAHQFFSGASPATHGDIRTRLDTLANNGRSDHWRVALKTFSASPLHGTGAGTYQFSWARYRHLTTLTVINAHSLYLQDMSELGIVGLILIVIVIAAVLVALLRRARGPNRVLYAGLFTAALAWAIHAGVDWDWEMPVVTAWVFAVGGLALSQRSLGRSAGERHAPTTQRGRVPIGVALLVVCATPALLMLSQQHLQKAGAALTRNNCVAADSQAISSISLLANRPQPYAILGYCDMSQGRGRDAIAAMQKAVQQEPGSWEYRYDLALALAANGQDPMPAIRNALQLDPHEQLINNAAHDFVHGTPASWPAASDRDRVAALDSGLLTLQ